MSDLLCTNVGAMKSVFNVFVLIKRCWLARKLETFVKIRKVVLEHEHRVTKRVEFAQLFEFFG